MQPDSTRIPDPHLVRPAGIDVSRLQASSRSDADGLSALIARASATLATPMHAQETTVELGVLRSMLDPIYSQTSLGKPGKNRIGLVSQVIFTLRTRCHGILPQLRLAAQADYQSIGLVCSGGSKQTLLARRSPKLPVSEKFRRKSSYSRTFSPLSCNAIRSLIRLEIGQVRDDAAHFDVLTLQSCRSS